MPNTPEGGETLRLEVKHFGVVSAPNNLCLGKKKKSFSDPEKLFLAQAILKFRMRVYLIRIPKKCFLQKSNL